MHRHRGTAPSFSWSSFASLTVPLFSSPTLSSAELASPTAELTARRSRALTPSAVVRLFSSLLPLVLSDVAPSFSFRTVRDLGMRVWVLLRSLVGFLRRCSRRLDTDSSLALLPSPFDLPILFVPRLSYEDNVILSFCDLSVLTSRILTSRTSIPPTLSLNARQAALVPSPPLKLCPRRLSLALDES